MRTSTRSPPEPLTAPPADDPWLSASRAADHLGLAPKRIYELAASGALPVGRDGRSIRIRRSALDAYLEGRAPDRDLTGGGAGS